MRPFLLFILLLFPICSGNCLPVPSKSDSIRYELRIIKNDLSRLRATNDSLNRELTFYRSKEDFYAGAFGSLVTQFSTQTSIYVAVVVAIFSFLSIGFYVADMRGVKRSIRQQGLDLARVAGTYEGRITTMEYTTYRQLAGIWGNLGTPDYFSPFLRFLVSSFAIDNNLKAHKVKPISDNSDDLEISLRNFIKALNEISRDDMKGNRKQLFIERTDIYTKENLKFLISDFNEFIKSIAIQVDLDIKKKRQEL